MSGCVRRSKFGSVDVEHGQEHVVSMSDATASSDDGALEYGDSSAPSTSMFQLTALSALICPCPLNELYPAPPWHTCAAPLSTAGKNE